MKHRSMAGLLGVLTLAGTLVSCTGEESTGADVTEYLTVTSTRGAAPSSSETGTTEPAAPEAEPASLYATVLDDPAHYSFTTNADYDLTGEYTYALVEMTGDDTPELLLMANTMDFHPIRVFSVGADGELIAPTETLLAGAASVGGSRVGLMATTEGDQVYQSSWQSISPTANAKGFALVDGTLAPTGAELTHHAVDTTAGNNLLKINWFPLGDRAPLSAMVPTTSKESSRSGAAGEAPPSSGANTYTGTIRVMTAPELTAPERTPNGEDDSHVHAILEFDAPTLFRASLSGGPGTDERETSIVGIGAQTPYSSYGTQYLTMDGQRVSVTVDPATCWFPSDTSLPLGQPRCDAVELN